MENENLATELLREVKASARRWFIAFLVVVGLWFATIAGFIWYITLPVDESASTTTIENRDGNANYIGDNSTGVIDNAKDNNQENE